VAEAASHSERVIDDAARRAEQLLLDVQAGADQLRSEVAQDTEMKELLTRAVAELPEKQQQVLSLYYFEELTMKEVGVVLGIGESRVSQIHSLAVVRLRARLEDLMGAKPEARAAASGGH